PLPRVRTTDPRPGTGAMRGPGRGAPSAAHPGAKGGHLLVAIQEGGGPDRGAGGALPAAPRAPPLPGGGPGGVTIGAIGCMLTGLSRSWKQAALPGCRRRGDAVRAEAAPAPSMAATDSR